MVCFSDHLLSTYCVLRIVSGHEVIRSLWTSVFGREVWLRERNSCVWICLRASCSLGKVCFAPWEADGWAHSLTKGKVQERKETRPQLCMGEVLEPWGSCAVRCPSYACCSCISTHRLLWRWVLWVLGVLSHLIPTVPLCNSMIISILHMKTWKYRQAT